MPIVVVVRLGLMVLEFASFTTRSQSFRDCFMGVDRLIHIRMPFVRSLLEATKRHVWRFFDYPTNQRTLPRWGEGATFATGRYLVEIQLFRYLCEARLIKAR